MGVMVVASGEDRRRAYAEVLAALLRVSGPKSRAQVLDVLLALDIGAAEAAAIVDHGLAYGVLTEDAWGIAATSPGWAVNDSVQRRRPHLS